MKNIIVVDLLNRQQDTREKQEKWVRQVWIL